MLKRVSKRLNKNGERGISLVEVILIMVILGISVIPLSRLSVGNLTSEGKYSIMMNAMYHAEEVMERIIADYAATADGRGYDWVIANWSGSSTPNPPAGLSGIVSISAEDTLNSVAYVVVQTTVSGASIPDVSLITWLINNN